MGGLVPSEVNEKTLLPNTEAALPISTVIFNEEGKAPLEMKGITNR